MESSPVKKGEVMGQGLEFLRSLEFTSPLLFLLVIPLLLALVAGIVYSRDRDKGRVRFSDPRHLVSVGSRKGLRARRIRIALLVILIIFSSLVLTYPVIRDSSQVMEQTTTQHTRTVIVVMDVSTSMRSRAEYNTEDMRTHFDIAREALIGFVSEQENMRIGVIFYSDEPLQYRRPDFNLEALTEDLESLTLIRTRRYWEEAPEPEEVNYASRQLSAMSKGTDTVPALFVASRTLQELDMQQNLNNAAIILFSDLKDRRSRVADTINQITEARVNVYVITSAGERLLRNFESLVGENPRVRIFDAESPVELDEAYREISELEAAPVEITERISTTTDIQEELGLFLFFFVILFVIISEWIYRRTRGS
ncbi:MAG: VWA domain-containing protein [Candidatus Spechtbacterales bacterium]|nr:VWA domain-containing protein [Candidatus Spechtbacterales bacterium]